MHPTGALEPCKTNLAETGVLMRCHSAVTRNLCENLQTYSFETSLPAHDCSHSRATSEITRGQQPAADKGIAGPKK